MGAPLELAITRHLAAILERLFEESGHPPEGWIFPSTITGMGFIHHLAQHFALTTEAGGAKFWYGTLSARTGAARTPS